MSSTSGAARGRRDMKLAERLAHEIVTDITRNGLGPGDRLSSEVLMAQEHGVSRASLREALRILEAHGLITIRTGPGGGPQLGELNPTDFARVATLHLHMGGVTYRQVLEARVMLEPPVAAAAAVNRTAEQIVAMRANVRELASTSREPEHALISREFHNLVAACAANKNPVLSLMTASLHSIFEIYARQSSTPPAAKSTPDIHAQICDAIEGADAERAAKLMELHMQESLNVFVDEHPTLIDSVVPWLTI
jgi:GntR family transcriptional regulator, transcriptional repressor for pyruvate dehydrogenase complex